MNGLTVKETVELRLKSLEPIYATASRYSFEKGQIFEIAEQAWAYATKPLEDVKLVGTAKAPKA